MEITTINAEALAKAFLAGAKNLEAKKEWINELNVFPVPDRYEYVYDDHVCGKGGHGDRGSGYEVRGEGDLFRFPTRRER